MHISHIELYHLRIPLKFAFITAKASLHHRDTLIIKVKDTSDIQGFGEVVAFTEPFYTKETLENAKEFLIKKAIPAILQNPLKHPFDIHILFKNFSKNFPMAIAGFENALLDLYSKKNKQNLISSLFEEALKYSVPIGIVYGDLPIDILCKKIKETTDIHSPHYTNCKRFKLKIKPKNNTENSFEKLKKLVETFPHLQFLADANQSFPLNKAHEIKEFDTLKLLCIEEPFHIEKLEDYKTLNCSIKTPLCFDESIQNIEEVKTAYNLGILHMLNIKIGRMGGLYHVKNTIEFCKEKHIPFWIGSMVESGISKILHVQLSALQGNCMAGDLSCSKRYFEKDIIIPEINTQNGEILVPINLGIGVDIDENTLNAYTYKKWYFSV